jgi:hypothetical protein
MGMCSGQLYKHNTRATPHLALQLVYFFSLPAKGVSSIARTELPYNERASARPAVSQPLFWLVSFPFTSFLCVCVYVLAHTKRLTWAWTGHVCEWARLICRWRPLLDYAAPDANIHRSLSRPIMSVDSKKKKGKNKKKFPVSTRWLIRVVFGLIDSDNQREHP